MSDKAETLAVGVSLVAAIIGAPFAAQLAAEVCHADATSARQAELTSRHKVPAVVMQPTSGEPTGYTLQSQVLVKAAWTAPSGTHRTGDVLASPGDPVGTTVYTWTDADGNVTTAPLTVGQVAGQSDLAAAGAVASIGLLFLCETLIVHQVLTRRRMAAWGDDWAVTAPQWTQSKW
ncbi:MAG TPA: hypothetical protein VGG75_22375 [Trebonia sp.]|jgi:hypothetical protein